MEADNYDLVFWRHKYYYIVYILLARWPGVTVGISVELKEEPITLQWCGDEPSIPAVNDPAVLQIPGKISEGGVTFTIRLSTGSISCQPGRNVTTFVLDFDGILEEAPGIHEKYEFSSVGSFYIEGYYYPPQEFCISEWTESAVAVRVCGGLDDSENNNWLYPACGIGSTCLPKCCPMNELLTSTALSGSANCSQPLGNSSSVTPESHKSLLQTSTPTQPVYYYLNDLGEKDLITFSNAKSNVDKASFPLVETICFQLSEDGSLLYLNHFDWIRVPASNYCVDGMQFGDGYLGPSHAFLGRKEDFGILLSVLPEEPKRMRIYPIMYASAYLIAVIALVVTLTVHVLLWKEQKLQGWIVMSLSVTMLMMYCINAAHTLSELMPRSHKPERTFLCTSSGVLLHFFYFSNFCWLTVMCFFLFTGFRKLTSWNPMNANSQNIGLYFRYAAFGWGLPFVFVTLSFGLDQAYSYNPCNTVIVPEYGVVACFIYEGALGPYLMYPIAVLLLLNLAFFSITSYNFCSHMKNARLARENLRANQQLSIFKIIAKLFFVMGFTWIFDFIAWLESGSERTWYWTITEVANCLQAVAIFIIYVCKASIVDSLKENHPKLAPLLSFHKKFSRSSVIQDTSLTMA